ncbi:MAG: AAA family ATPase [Myxococcota bacterium]|nr:AAA family ATPase [Myxococcota bacterium]
MKQKCLSADAQLVYEQAQDIAHQAEQAFTTAHMLLALFVVPNRAETLLFEHGVNEELLLSHLSPTDREAAQLGLTAEGRAAAFADSTGSGIIGCLHILAALTEIPESIAYRLLTRCGMTPALIRARCLHAVDDEQEKRGHDADPGRRETAAYAVLDDREASAKKRRATVQSDGPEIIAHAPQRVRFSSGIQHDRFARMSDDERRSPSPGRRSTDRPSRDGRRQDRRDLTEHGEGHAETEVSSEPSGPFILDPERFEWLTKLGTNMSEHAWRGGYDPVVGRDREIEETIDILNKRRSNNPCLIGEPGVGKTAIVSGVVSHLVEAYRRGDSKDNRVFVQVDVGAILAGTQLRGSLSERLRGLQAEVRSAEGQIVVFVDEVHTLIGAGGNDGGNDAANELKAALARGEFPCVGATTVDEFKKYIESDPALERRFSPVHVSEPDEVDTLHIVSTLATRYAEHHGVEYTTEGLDAAVRLGRRYLHERCDPDRSLGLLDLAGAVSRRASGRVDRRAVAEVIARAAQVPIDHILVEDAHRYLTMEDRLGEHVVGQPHVLKALAESLRRNLAGFAGRQPIGSFLFLGPTGVGKTETVKALAEFLFGRRDAMVRFDMSEFLEAHSVSRLIGAPPGYVGYSEGGQLTDRIRRRPYQVILFDEIEKSHRDVWNILLQLLDEGQLTDSTGRTVDFSNTVVIMTSNLGAKAAQISDRRIGFAHPTSVDRDAYSKCTIETAKRAFPPELWNRIQRRLVFYPLDSTAVERIARLIMAERARLLARERHVTLTVRDDVYALLVAEGGFDPELGARPMRQAIARTLETPLAERILAGAIKTGDSIVVDVDDGCLRFRHTDDPSAIGDPAENEHSDPATSVQI